MLFNVPWRNFRRGMASNRHRSRFGLMMKLPMASSGTRQFPAIIFNFLNHVSYFQSGAFLESSQISLSRFAATFAASACGRRGRAYSLASRSVIAAGVAFTLGVAVGCGVASCVGVPDDEGDPAASALLRIGIATGLGVGLAFACMFIAFFPSAFRLAQTQSGFRCSGCR